MVYIIIYSHTIDMKAWRSVKTKSLHSPVPPEVPVPPVSGELLLPFSSEGTQREGVHELSSCTSANHHGNRGSLPTWSLDGWIARWLMDISLDERKDEEMGATTISRAFKWSWATAPTLTEHKKITPLLWTEGGRKSRRHENTWEWGSEWETAKKSKKGKYKASVLLHQPYTLVMMCQHAICWHLWGYFCSILC